MLNKKKKSGEKRLSLVLARQQLWIYIVALVVLAAMIVFIVLYFFTYKILYFYLLIGFGLAAVVYVLIRVAIIPTTTSNFITKNLTEDMGRALISVPTGKTEIVLNRTGVEEFDDLKKRLSDIMNSFADVTVVDRAVDDSYLKFGYEYGFDRLITKESFIYNLPFILKLNGSSRGGLVLIKIQGDELTPTDEAINRLIAEITKAFTTKFYLGRYSSDTLIVYVTDVESLPIFKNVLFRIFYSYYILKNELSNSIVYSSKIGAAVFPYSTSRTLLSDAKEALAFSTNVNIFMPVEFTDLRNTKKDSREDVTKKNIIALEKMISYLYHFGSNSFNDDDIKKTLLPIVKSAGFMTYGIISRSSSYSSTGSEVMTCLEEEGNPTCSLFKGRGDISFDEIRPFYDFKDEDDIFYSTRREDLPPVLAEYFDRHSLTGVMASFFGTRNQVLGMSYLISSDKSEPITSIDSYVLSLCLIILNFISMGKVESYRSSLIEGDMEDILAMDGKLRYIVNQKTYAIEGMSNDLHYIFGNGSLGKKCYKVFFSLDEPCKDCPLVSGMNINSQITFILGKKFLRRKLSYNTPDNVASIIYTPYKIEDDYKKGILRFDPLTYLSSRAAFNDTMQNIILSKAKGTLISICLEGANKIVSSFGEGNLINILIETRKRVFDLEICDRIYRYDEATLSIFFDNATRIQAYDLVEKIEDALENPFLIESKMIKCSFKYSELNFNSNFTSLSEVLGLIDKGLNQVKKLPPRTLSIANESISRMASKSDYIIYLMEENYLNKAVEFRIQPILATKDNSIRYGEILLRLYDTLREKMLSPLEVVSIASSNKKMGKFDSLNYETAVNLYNKYFSGAFRMYGFNGLSINLSSDSLDSNDWLARIKRYIETNPVPSSFLGLEISESSIHSELGRVKVWHNDLASFSLNWLIDNYEDIYITPREAAELGFKTLKLSRKFLISALADPVSKGLFESVIREAHYNGLLIVAQGVETKEQFDFCCTSGADYIQGFYLFEPQKIDDFLAALAEKPDLKKLYDWKKYYATHSLARKKDRSFHQEDSKKNLLRRKLISRRQEKEDKKKLKEAKRINKLEQKADKEEKKIAADKPSE